MDFEKLIKRVKLSSEVITDDRLAKLIDSFEQGELSVDSLEFVAAAGKSDYEKFRERMNGKGVGHEKKND